MIDNVALWRYAQDQRTHRKARMRSDAIFLNVGGQLVPLHETPYETEAVLQTALAEHPEVLVGPTTAGDDDGTLLLVRQEMGVPAQLGGGSVWSLDHLFLDADGVPVVVEVKRASDTRIRREVVGQMLDYAANGSKYWPVAELREGVEQRSAGDGPDPVSALWPDVDVDEFWETVETNLQAGKIRLLFVADKIPPELARIIEFLNEQMSPAEVLGVELRQYAGAGQVAYVPRVIGQTSRAQETKAVSQGRPPWTREEFLTLTDDQLGPAGQALVRRLLSDPVDRGLDLLWGRSRVTPGVSGRYRVAGRPGSLWNLHLSSPTQRPGIYLNFPLVVGRVPPERLEAAAQHAAKITELAPKVEQSRASGWTTYPHLSLEAIADNSAAIEELLAAIGALIDHD
jgi:hypothetical protein